MKPITTILIFVGSLSLLWAALVVDRSSTPEPTIGCVLPAVPPPQPHVTIISTPTPEPVVPALANTDMVGQWQLSHVDGADLSALRKMPDVKILLTLTADRMALSVTIPRSNNGHLISADYAVTESDAHQARLQLSNIQTHQPNQQQPQELPSTPSFEPHIKAVLEGDTLTLSMPNIKGKPSSAVFERVQ